MLDDLLLLSGNDIPFYQAQISIHQPRLKEIGYIGEEDFHIGSHFLLFSKDDLSSEDKLNLENQSDFNIFMSIMNSKEVAKHKTDAQLVLALLFPNATIHIEKDKILLQSENFLSSLNEENYSDFKSILKQIFCLGDLDSEKFNPADDLAKRIAEKIKKSKEKKNKSDKKLDKISIYSQYISILSVGLKKDMNELLNYTIYQLRDEYKRFMLKQDFDLYIQAKIAGAKDLEEVSNWMEDIHP